MPTPYDAHYIYDFHWFYDLLWQNVVENLTETINLFESLQASADFKVSLVDSITLTDILSYAQDLKVTLQEMIDVSDTLEYNANMAIMLSEAINVMEQLYLWLNIHLSDTVTTTDSIEIDIATLLQEIVHLTEQFTTQTDYTDLHQEDIYLMERLKKCINWVKDVWWEEASPTTNWNSREQVTASWSSRTKPTTTRSDRDSVWCNLSP